MHVLASHDKALTIKARPNWPSPSSSIPVGPYVGAGLTSSPSSISPGRHSAFAIGAITKVFFEMLKIRDVLETRKNLPHKRFTAVGSVVDAIDCLFEPSSRLCRRSQQPSIARGFDAVCHDPPDDGPTFPGLKGTKLIGTADLKDP
ncbi:MAG: hypothetical protein MI785_29090 [Kiloniellales bacterium]|nr:hypothetical protein [Kiloniellales bacterium]